MLPSIIEILPSQVIISNPIADVCLLKACEDITYIVRCQVDHSLLCMEGGLLQDVNVLQSSQLTISDTFDLRLICTCMQTSTCE